MVRARQLDREAADLASEAGLEALREMRDDLSNIWERSITEQVSHQCCSMLQAVRGITATYRMTNKPAPTAPSPFVAHILKPLSEYRSRWGGRLPVGIEAAEGWEVRVAEAVTERYIQAVEELISTVLQMEEALRKRKSSRAQRASTIGSGGPSDTEKILMQLRLDADAYLELAVEAGLDRLRCEPLHCILSQAEQDRALAQG